MKQKYFLPARYIMVLLLVICTIAPRQLFAQIDFEDDVEDVPLDGGVTAMIAAGVAYGIRKARVGRNNRKKSNTATIGEENKIGIGA